MLTTLPWAFVYTNPASMVPPELLGKPLQPYPAYEMIFDLTLLGLLWRLRELGRPRPRILAPEQDKFRASKDGEGGG